MTRAALDSASRSEAGSRKPYEVLFVYIPFPSATVTLCTDDREQTFTDPDLGSLTFLPGRLSIIENLNENDTSQPERATLTLTGCDADIISACVGDAVHWLRICIWLGYLDTSGVLVTSPPYRLFDGFLGSPTIQTAANGSTIALTAETLNAALSRISQVRGCDADQQLRFSTDLFFHQVSVNGNRAVAMGNDRKNIGGLVAPPGAGGGSIGITLPGGTIFAPGTYTQ